MPAPKTAKKIRRHDRHAPRCWAPRHVENLTLRAFPAVPSPTKKILRLSEGVSMELKIRSPNADSGPELGADRLGSNRDSSVQAYPFPAIRWRALERAERAAAGADTESRGGHARPHLEHALAVARAQVGCADEHIIGTIQKTALLGDSCYQLAHGNQATRAAGNSRRHSG